MKKIAILIGIVAIAVFSIILVQKNNSKIAQVSVVPESIDFGEIVQSNGTVSETVLVKNIGSKTLVINRLSTSCGCTTAEMDESDMLPGEIREMKVTFDPMVHPDQFGEITRVVYLQTSDPENPEVEIDVRGFVLNPNNEK